MDSNIILQPDASMTTLAAAQANVLAGTTREVGLLNDNLKTQYLNGFNNWAENVLIGRVENTNPPQPPNAYTVEVGADGWAYPAQGTTPICPMPPIPQVPPPYTPPVLPQPANVRNVQPGDTMPVGFVLTADDGSQWQKQASPTPFGVAYYYARVS